MTWRFFMSLCLHLFQIKYYMSEYPDACLSGLRYFDPRREALPLRYGS